MLKSLESEKKVSSVGLEKAEGPSVGLRRASDRAGSVLKGALRASDRAGRASEGSGRGSEGVGRA